MRPSPAKSVRCTAEQFISPRSALAKLAVFVVLGAVPISLSAQEPSDRGIIRRVIAGFDRSGLRFDRDSCDGAMNCYR